MQDIPKIVLKRLPEVAAAEVHPDADVLTAFAEQALGKRERDRVMEHLSRCGDCREVVAVALPIVEDASAVAAGGVAGPGWLTWPVLRWGFVAAGVLLVGSVGTLQYRQHERHNASVISKLQSAEQTAQSPAQNSISTPSELKRPASFPQSEAGKQIEGERTAAGSAATPQANTTSSTFAAPVRSESSRANSAGATGRIAGSVSRVERGAITPAPPQDALLFAPSANGARVITSPKQAPSPVADPAALSSQTVEVQSAAPEVAQPGVAQEVAQNEVAQNQPQGTLANLPVQGRSADADVVKAKDLTVQHAVAAPAVASTPILQASTSASSTQLSGSPQWAISANGDLQRSFDAGKTWEDVNVAGALFGGKLKQQNAYKKEYAENKTEKKQKPQPAGVVVFRAVAAMNAEVWAGGSEAVLIHSSDFGGHWIRVFPAEAGVVLTGDVVGVEFGDPQSGKVATSAGEIWTTADAGQSWHKQQ